MMQEEESVGEDSRGDTAGHADHSGIKRELGADHPRGFDADSYEVPRCTPTENDGSLSVERRVQDVCDSSEGPTRSGDVGH